jgi:single-strand DNA-binding protein
MNKAILIGNLGGDPKIRSGQNDFLVTKFNLATSERWRDRDTGELQERTEWHQVAAFGKLAEICEKYLSKGKKVCVEGRLQTSKYEKDGITRYSTEIIASNVQFLSPKSLQDTEYISQITESSNTSEQERLAAGEEEIPF